MKSYVTATAKESSIDLSKLQERFRKEFKSDTKKLH